MHNLVAILQTNIVGMILMIITICGILKNVSWQRLSDKLFLCLTVAVFFSCFFEIMSYVFDFRTFPGAILTNRIANVLLFIVNPITAYLWALYVYYKIFNDTKKLLFVAKVISIPLIIVVIASFANLFVDIFFTISDENVYQRTDLYIVATLLNAFYLMYAVVIIFLQRKNINKSLALPLLSFMILPTVGILFQFFFYGQSVLWVSIAISTVIVYNYVQNDYSNIDWLTRVYNRKHLDQHIKAQCKKKASTKLVGLLMDLNDFKQINDEYGHIEGDFALQKTVALLKKVLGYKRYLARFAGDEFVALFEVTSEYEISSIIQEIHQTFEQYNATSEKRYSITLSIGFAINNREESNGNLFLKAMDESMYKEKKRYRDSKM